MPCLDNSLQPHSEPGAPLSRRVKKGASIGCPRSPGGGRLFGATDLAQPPLMKKAMAVSVGGP
jgi:hypothetical protein